MTNEEKTKAIAHLIGMIYTFKNADAVSRDHAVNAILEGWPAYWSTAKYHDAVTSEIQNELNKGKTFDEIADTLEPRHFRDYHYFIGRIIGLNDAAREAKEEALKIYPEAV